jgi:hypothetical protein
MARCRAPYQVSCDEHPNDRNSESNPHDVERNRARHSLPKLDREDDQRCPYRVKPVTRFPRAVSPHVLDDPPSLLLSPLAFNNPSAQSRTASATNKPNDLVPNHP